MVEEKLQKIARSATAEKVDNAICLLVDCIICILAWPSFVRQLKKLLKLG